MYKIITIYIYIYIYNKARGIFKVVLVYGYGIKSSDDSRLKPIRACALMWGISRTGMGN